MIHKIDSDGKQETIREKGQVDPGLQAAMEDFSRAMSTKDIDGMAKAFMSAFQVVDAEPQISEVDDIDGPM